MCEEAAPEAAATGGNGGGGPLGDLAPLRGEAAAAATVVTAAAADGSVAAGAGEAGSTPAGVGDGAGGGAGLPSPSAGHAAAAAATASAVPSLAAQIPKSKKQRAEERRKASHDALVLLHEPRPPAGLGASGVELLGRLLSKSRDGRIGACGAHEVMAHPWFEDEPSFSWREMREGEAAPPLTPSADVINAGSIADAGGTDDHDDPNVGRVRFGPDDMARFASWEWRDELLMQQEILMAIEADASRAAERGFFSASCNALLDGLCGCGICWWWRLVPTHELRPAAPAAPATRVAVA